MSLSKRTFIGILGLLAFIFPAWVLAQLVNSAFNPNSIVPDAVFSDTKTFGGPEGIQKFLESKNSPLANTTPDFLSKLSEPDNPLLKKALDDPQPALPHSRTAAEIIWDAAQSSGLNPQVILVTLNKEQGLITGRSASDPGLQRALNHAMGFDCPDATGCGNLFPGFYYQLFGNVDTSGNRYLGATKSLMKSFSASDGRGPQYDGKISRVGDTIMLGNTMGDYTPINSQQTITLGNRATAALYRYTPHVFNGNYNFWKFFTAWFKYPNGTLVRATDSGLMYVIQNGTLQLLPQFVAVARKLDFSTAISLSPTEMTTYPFGLVYGPADNTVITAGDRYYVFINQIKHPASSFVLTQRSLDPTKAIQVFPGEVSLFPDGPQLTPKNGTVVRGASTPNIYIVKDDILRLFSEFTFKQYNAKKLLQIIPDEEIASYPKDGYVSPLKGTLVTSPSSTTVYLIGDDQKRPLTDSLFSNLGFNKKDVVKLATDEELTSIPHGSPPSPRDNTFFSIEGSREYYLFKDGAKHPTSIFVTQQRKLVPHFSFDASIANNWPDSIAIPPIDGTLVKSDVFPTVYVVGKGQLHPLTKDLFDNLGYRTKNIVSLPDGEIQSYATGDSVMPKEATWFSVKETRDVYLFKKGSKHTISSFVAKQRGITPDYSFPLDIVNAWPNGDSIMPRDNTLLKSFDNPDLYLVAGGKLSLISSGAIKKRGLSLKNVQTIPQTEFDSYPKGIKIPDPKPTKAPKKTVKKKR